MLHFTIPELHISLNNNITSKAEFFLKRPCVTVCPIIEVDNIVLRLL